MYNKVSANMASFTHSDHYPDYHFSWESKTGKLSNRACVSAMQVYVYVCWFKATPTLNTGYWKYYNFPPPSDHYACVQQNCWHNSHIYMCIPSRYKVRRSKVTFNFWCYYEKQKIIVDCHKHNTQVSANKNTPKSTSGQRNTNSLQSSLTGTFLQHCKTHFRSVSLSPTMQNVGF